MQTPHPGLRGRPPRLVLALLATTLCLGGTGCRSGNPVHLPRWTMTTDGTPGATVVTFPAHLNHLLPKRRCQYILRTRARIPEGLRGREAILTFPTLQAMASATVNDHPVLPLDGDVIEVYRRSEPNAWRVQLPQTATVDIEVVVSHTWVKSAWEDAVPYLSPMSESDLRLDWINPFNQITQLVGISSLLSIVIISTILFCLDRRRRPFWLALQLTAPILILWFELGSMQLVFGVYDTAVVGVTLSFAIIAGAYATHAKFGLPGVHWLWPALQGATIVTAFIFPGSVSCPTVLDLRDGVHRRDGFCLPVVHHWTTICALASGSPDRHRGPGVVPPGGQLCLRHGHLAGRRGAPGRHSAERGWAHPVFLPGVRRSCPSIRGRAKTK